MKKFIISLMALTLCVGMPTMTMAQATSKKLQKQLAKETTKQYKKKIKEYKKGGWQVFGTTNTLEVALLTHYEKKGADNLVELHSTAASTNKNIGKEKLAMNACAEYAKLAGSHLRGRIVSDFGSDLTTSEIAEFDRIYGAYENNVQTSIKGELRPSFYLFREVKKDGDTILEFEGYYLIDQESATKARLRAFENAAKESAVAQRYARRISEFINEGFVPEEEEF